MLSIIKNRIKNSKYLSYIYFSAMKAILKIILIVTPVEPQTVLFSSFSGRQFSDSPRAVFNALDKDPRFSGYHLVWAKTKNLNNELFPCKSVDIDSFKFLFMLARAKYWVSNASIERLIPVNHSNHIYIQTWHGVPLKHLGKDEPNLKYLIKNWYKNVRFDLLTASSTYDARIFSKIFPNSAEAIQSVGLPRNAEMLDLATDSQLIHREIIEELDLDPTKKILLFAPTFREFEEDQNGFERLNTKLSKNMLHHLREQYNFLVRGHYFTSSTNHGSEDYIDVTEFADLNKLLVAADILITDYSSIMFDFSLLSKPILLFIPDIETYLHIRGVYLDPRNLGLPYTTNETDLTCLLSSLDSTQESQNIRQFSHRFSGTDPHKSLEVIKEKILETS